MSMSDLVGETFTDLAVQAHPNGFYVLRDPVTFSQERGYYEQWAYGYLEELKSILERDGGRTPPRTANLYRARSELADLTVPCTNFRCSGAP